jgi:hypothetical protein
LAEASLLAGDVDEALSHVTGSLRQAIKYRERGEEAYARWLHATILSANGEDFATVGQQFHDAACLAAELGMKPLLAHCYLGLGDLEAYRGGTRTRPPHREWGLRLLETLGMRRWISLNRSLTAAIPVPYGI